MTRVVLPVLLSLLLSCFVGFTPLMRAVDNSHEAAVRRPLLTDANVDAMDEQGNSALHHVIANGDDGIATLLAEAGADDSLANRAGMTPRVMAEQSATDKSSGSAR